MDNEKRKQPCKPAPPQTLPSKSITSNPKYLKPYQSLQALSEDPNPSSLQSSLVEVEQQSSIISGSKTSIVDSTDDTEKSEVNESILPRSDKQVCNSTYEKITDPKKNRNHIEYFDDDDCPYCLEDGKVRVYVRKHASEKDPPPQTVTSAAMLNQLNSILSSDRFINPKFANLYKPIAFCFDKHYQKPHGFEKIANEMFLYCKLLSIDGIPNQLLLSVLSDSLMGVGKTRFIYELMQLLVSQLAALEVPRLCLQSYSVKSYSDIFAIMYLHDEVVQGLLILLQVFNDNFGNPAFQLSNMCLTRDETLLLDYLDCLLNGWSHGKIAFWFINFDEFQNSESQMFRFILKSLRKWNTEKYPKSISKVFIVPFFSGTTRFKLLNGGNNGIFGVSNYHSINVTIPLDQSFEHAFLDEFDLDEPSYKLVSELCTSFAGWPYAFMLLYKFFKSHGTEVNFKTIECIREYILDAIKAKYPDSIWQNALGTGPTGVTKFLYWSISCLPVPTDVMLNGISLATSAEYGLFTLEKIGDINEAMVLIKIPPILIYLLNRSQENRVILYQNVADIWCSNWRSIEDTSYVYLHLRIQALLTLGHLSCKLSNLFPGANIDPNISDIIVKLPQSKNIRHVKAHINFCDDSSISRISIGNNQNFEISEGGVLAFAEGQQLYDFLCAFPADKKLKIKSLILLGQVKSREEIVPSSGLPSQHVVSKGDILEFSEYSSNKDNASKFGVNRVVSAYVSTRKPRLNIVNSHFPNCVFVHGLNFRRVMGQYFGHRVDYFKKFDSFEENDEKTDFDDKFYINAEGSLRSKYHRLNCRYLKNPILLKVDALHSNHEACGICVISNINFFN